MGDLPITVDENNFETGTREILRLIRANWKKDLIKFKVSCDVFLKCVRLINEEEFIGFRVVYIVELCGQKNLAQNAR